VQTGPKELTEESQGVNYRALNDLFHMSETRTDTFSYEISVQMIEIYNEQVRDLLANNSGSNKRYPFMFLLNFPIFLSKIYLNPEV
jgi:kinesin family member C2/C3